MGSSPFDEVRTRRVDLGLWMVQVGTWAVVVSVAVAALGGLVATDGGATTVLARLLRALLPWTGFGLLGGAAAIVLGALLASTAVPGAARLLGLLAAVSFAVSLVLELRAGEHERVSGLRWHFAALAAQALGWVLLHSHLARLASYVGGHSLARTARACRAWTAFAAAWVVGVDALDRLRGEASAAGEREALGTTFVVAGIGGLVLLLLVVTWTLRLLGRTRAALSARFTAPASLPPPA